MEQLSDFVMATLSGVSGNAVYNSLTNILGDKTTNRLKSYIKEKNTKSFSNTLEIIFDDDEKKKKVTNLMAGKINAITQYHFGNGDMVAGDKYGGDNIHGNKNHYK